jgi:hypothetical protein
MAPKEVLVAALVEALVALEAMAPAVY